MFIKTPKVSKYYIYKQDLQASIIRKTKCSGISEQNVPFPKRNVPL